jgi:hypothetical protein
MVHRSGRRGLASILASVNARAVVPKLARWGVLHAKLDQARDAVAAVFDLRTENSAAVSQEGLRSVRPALQR